MVCIQKNFMVSRRNQTLYNCVLLHCTGHCTEQWTSLVSSASDLFLTTSMGLVKIQEIEAANPPATTSILTLKLSNPLVLCLHSRLLFFDPTINLIFVGKSIAEHFQRQELGLGTSILPSNSNIHLVIYFFISLHNLNFPKKKHSFSYLHLTDCNSINCTVTGPCPTVISYQWYHSWAWCKSPGLSDPLGLTVWFGSSSADSLYWTELHCTLVLYCF